MSSRSDAENSLRLWLPLKEFGELPLKDFVEIVTDTSKDLTALNDRLTALSLRVAALEHPLLADVDKEWREDFDLSPLAPPPAGCPACEDPEALIFDDHPG